MLQSNGPAAALLHDVGQAGGTYVMCRALEIVSPPSDPYDMAATRM